MSVRIEADRDSETGRLRLVVEADTDAGFNAALVMGLAALGKAEPKRRLGTSRRPLRKLTDEQAREIRRRHDRGESATPLAKEFGTPVRSIYNILQGHTYANPEAYP